MWFNYRKPRNLKRGAYYYAAKNNVPIVPIFVEIQNLDEKETEELNVDTAKRKNHIAQMLKELKSS